MSWAAEVGVVAVNPETGAVLRLLAAATRARHVVEIGTGTGVSGLWLLRGMHPEGVLTSIDIEPEHQAMARQSFAAAGIAAGRARLIPGHARDVLSRLADATYDLVFVDCEVSEYPHCVSAAHRLLREGGLLILNNDLDSPQGTDTIIVRELVAYIRDAPEWTPAMLSAGSGLLCAARNA